VTETKPLANESLITVATVDGTNWQHYPEDLYIPPDALEVFVDIFEGPLDLLLYLIKKQNLDILTIPVAQITRQYMDYVELMQILQLELAAEYLLMAALLAEIKSTMLLPRKVELLDEPEQDLREVLIAKLKEYERIKKAAENLDQLPRQERDIFPARVDLGELVIKQYYPEVALTELVLAFQTVLQRVTQTSDYQITKEPLSVQDRMNDILQRLQHQQSVSFYSLCDLSEGRAGVVVVFLAILELSKEGLIEILQTEPFAELWLKTVSIPALI
jgi:segregation and condensation protein A